MRQLYVKTHVANHESENDKTPKKKKDKKKRKKEILVEETNEQKEEEKEEEKVVHKKQKKTEDATKSKENGNGNHMKSLQHEIDTENIEGSEVTSPTKEKKTPKKGNTPFQRVKAEEVDFLDHRLKNNSYNSKQGDSWGEQASADLIVVRGKDFRHAKTKKKKGTYRGGSLDMGINSFKFPTDE